MKKIVALLLALCMVAALCACGSESKTDEDMNKAPEQQETAPQPETKPEEAPETKPEEKVEEKPEEKAEEEAEEKPEEEKSENGGYEKGTVNGLKYENKVLGISCTFTDSWYIATEEDIAEIMGITADLLTDTAMEESIESGNAVCDLYAMDADYSTLNIQVTKFDSVFERMQLAVLSEEELVDGVLEEFETSGEDQIIYSSLGIEGGKMEKSTVKIDGKDHFCIRLSGVIPAEEGDLPIFETMIFKTSGKYMGNITICSYIEDTTDAAAAMFKLY